MTHLTTKTTAEKTAISAQEEARFNDLMRATYPKVFNMAYRLTQSRSDAEDLTQEAFFRAYRSFQDYEGDRPFENWIYRIVTRLFLDLLRLRRRRIKTVSFDNPITVGSDEMLAVEVADQSPQPDEIVLQQSLSEPLQTVLNSLTEEQRLLIILADVQNVPYAEIAEMLNKPVGTIRSRLHRTHKLIRHRLEQAEKAANPKPKTGLGWNLRPQFSL